MEGEAGRKYFAVVSVYETPYPQLPILATLLVAYMLPFKVPKNNQNG
ncbi:hypothetical protein JCM19237_4431 [Photobacterium aphoticum]|uniref:Uncharacterized protein n=1 Tax=Photobacterium aphoticum TaxID=754436 RepID=A0A090R104_9GAMM|nr:hypothetical protein JCM19237_4431 [Photobacterium aphoticum]